MLWIGFEVVGLGKIATIERALDVAVASGDFVGVRFVGIHGRGRRKIGGCDGS